MRSLEIEKSMEQLSVIDLFDSIDNVNNNNEENDKIIKKVKEKVGVLLKSYLKKEREKKRREEMLQHYKIYLKCFQEVIEKQEEIIDNLTEEDDVVDTMFDLKNEIIDYSMRIYESDLLNISEILGKKEQTIYQYIHLYDFLWKYNNEHEKHKFPLSINMDQSHKKEEKSKEKLNLSNWKTYFYLVVCLKKQQEYNHTFTSYFMSRNRIETNKESFIKLSDFYAADFQGQLSKNIYCQRKKLKLTQMQLSERSGIDRTMIAKIEKVKQPTTLETAVKLLTSLNLGIAIYPFDEIEENLDTIKKRN
mgnify:FL=1